MDDLFKNSEQKETEVIIAKLKSLVSQIKDYLRGTAQKKLFMYVETVMK